MSPTSVSLESSEEMDQSKHSCSFFSKTKMKRQDFGIQHCGSCMKTVASLDWPTTPLLMIQPVRRWKEKLGRVEEDRNRILYVKRKENIKAFVITKLFI